MGILSWVVLGGLAGWVASMVMGTNAKMGAMANIVVGILGSIIGPGARLSHVGGRIEGSTIGCDSNIFRDFRLPRAMRLHVGEGVEISLS